MEWTIVVLTVITLTSLTAAIYLYRQNKRISRLADRMMDEILADKPVIQGDLEEGEVSALAAKARRIQEKILIEVGLAEQEKEQVKSLIANMSHQLKTPLANVMMYEDILSEEGISEEERAKFLLKMKQQTEKVSWILNSLFKMVKLEQNVIAFDAKPNMLRKTLLDAVNLVYAKAEKKQIEVVTEYFPDCRLYHNPKWTSEVFANILENAVKYSPECGRITIGARRFEMYTEIWIQDAGIGIAKEEMTNIFKRFYRSGEVINIEGSGIGLYLCKLILEKEKGYINVASEQGVGSRFSVFLQNC